jgi:hypothetical protein
MGDPQLYIKEMVYEYLSVLFVEDDITFRSRRTVR